MEHHPARSPIRALETVTVTAMHPALLWVLYQLRESEITPGALSVHLYLLSLTAAAPPGAASCQVQVSRIVAGTERSESSVHNARGELQRLRWVRVQPMRVQRRRSARQAPNCYHILNQPPGWRVAPGTMHPALKWVLDQLRKGRMSKGVLLVYLDLLWRSDVVAGYAPTCQRSIAQIGADTGLSTRGVRYAVADLQRRGLVTVRASPDTAQVPNRYSIEQLPEGWQHTPSQAPS